MAVFLDLGFFFNVSSLLEVIDDHPEIKSEEILFKCFMYHFRAWDSLQESVRELTKDKSNKNIVLRHQVESRRGKKLVARFPTLLKKDVATELAIYQPSIARADSAMKDLFDAISRYPDNILSDFRSFIIPVTDVVEVSGVAKLESLRRWSAGQVRVRVGDDRVGIECLSRGFAVFWV